jgi:hypothetical protein
MGHRSVSVVAHSLVGAPWNCIGQDGSHPQADGTPTDERGRELPLAVLLVASAESGALRPPGGAFAAGRCRRAQATMCGRRLRPNVALTCCRLIGPSRLDGELAARRAALDAGTPESMPAARAAAARFAVQAASALVVHEGSRSVVVGSHPERLLREATFLLVFGSRPSIRRALSAQPGMTSAARSSGATQEARGHPPT